MHATEHPPSPASRAGTDFSTNGRAVSRAVSYVNTHLSGSRLGRDIPRSPRHQSPLGVRVRVHNQLKGQLSERPQTTGLTPVSGYPDI